MNQKRKNCISIILSTLLNITAFVFLFCSYSRANDEILNLRSNYINVHDLGARGDGKTDDTEALQKALNQGPGKTIFFPKGNYLISKSLNLLSGTELVGEGDVGGESGSSILPKNNLKTYAIFTSNSKTLSDVIFRNIRTLRAKYSLSVNVKGGYVTKLKWYNCVFQEHEICINIEGSNTDGMYANMIRDSYFKTSKLGIFCQGPFNMNVIQGCGFENMGNGYLKLNENSVYNLANSFIENRCESVLNTNGIGIELSRNVIGFYIERNFFENSFRNIFTTNGARNVEFSNNIYTNSITGAYGLLLVNGGNASIKNNNSLTGFILDINNRGYCNEISANGFLNFSESVKKENLGTVNNQYNIKYNTQ